MNDAWFVLSKSHLNIPVASPDLSKTFHLKSSQIHRKLQKPCRAISCALLPAPPSGGISREYRTKLGSWHGARVCTEFRAIYHVQMWLLGVQDHHTSAKWKEPFLLVCVCVEGSEEGREKPGSLLSSLCLPERVSPGGCPVLLPDSSPYIAVPFTSVPLLREVAYPKMVP